MAKDMKVEGYPNLRRRGAGVVNTDVDGYRQHMHRRSQASRLHHLEEQVLDMKAKLDFIYEALTRTPDAPKQVVPL